MSSLPAPVVAAAVVVAFLAALRAWLAFRGRPVVVGERQGTTVIVRRRGRFRELVLANDGHELVQSRQDVDHPLRAGPGYVDGLHLGMLVRPRPVRVLFLGGGAGIAPRQFEAAYPGVELDVVEINPFVVAAATHHFGLRITKDLSIHVADARTFVAKSEPASYDLVVLDVYDAHGIPRGLVTTPFFESLARVLAPEGALVLNLAVTAGVDHPAALASLGEALPALDVACFDVGTDNVLVLAAPSVPDDAALVERAAAITVAPGLVAIARARRP